MKKENVIITILAATIASLSVLNIVQFAQHNKNNVDTSNLEIERKYLLDAALLPKEVLEAKSSHMIQTYISWAPEMRVRQIDNLYHFLTIKTPRDTVGLVREEIEFLIAREEYEEFLPKKVGETIYKTRYELFVNKVKVEVDVYEEQLEGLFVAEIEFETVELSRRFTPPSWLGADITSDLRYKNANLARYGMPE